jgi:hypothetical protein
MYLITECLFGYEIQAAASIGRRFTIHHGYGVVINKHVVVGMILPTSRRHHRQSWHQFVLPGNR